MDSINGDHKELQIMFEINIHGIISIKLATLLMEKKVLRTQAVGNKRTFTLKEHISMNSMEMDNNAQVIVVKENALVSVHIHGGMTADELREAVEREREMTNSDKIMEETKDKKNVLEAYVYNTREKIESKYRDYATDEEKRSLLSSLQEVEDWLYGEGEDMTKNVYADKLEWLKQQGDPIEERYNEDMQRNTAIKSADDFVNKYWAVAHSNDPKFDHISIPEREKIKECCLKTGRWLLCEKKEQQGALPKNVNPVLKCADMRGISEKLESICKPIVEKPRAPLNKPRAPPPKAQTSRNDQRQQEQLRQEQRQYQKWEEDKKQDRYQQAQQQQQLNNKMQQKPSDSVEQERTTDNSDQEQPSGSEESNNGEDPKKLVPSHLTNNSTEEPTSVDMLPATK